MNIEEAIDDKKRMKMEIERVSKIR